jgi:hypothetical protein
LPDLQTPPIRMPEGLSAQGAQFAQPMMSSGGMKRTW